MVGPCRLFAIFLLTAAACGGVSQSSVDAGDGDGDDDAGEIDAPPMADCNSGSISIGDMKECYSQAICRLFTTCSARFESITECRELVYPLFRTDGFDFELQIDLLIAAIQAGRVELNEEDLARCLFPEGDECNGSPPECETLFSGLVPAAGSCFLNEECQRGGACNVTTQTGQCNEGTCEAPAGLGASCVGGIRCERGLQCGNDVTGAQVCVSGDLGTACQNNSGCDRGLFCDAGLTCQPLRTLGQTCINNECVNPLSCVAGTCQRPDTDGAACTFSCIGQLFCDDSGPGSVCRPLPVLGQSCAESRSCLGGTLFCASNNLCLQRADVGGGCDVERSSCRAGLFCDNASATCAAPRANGSTCELDRECDSGFCDDSGITPACGARSFCY